MAILYCGVNGYLDEVPLEKIADFERAFHDHLRASAPDVMEAITGSGLIEEATEQSLKRAIDDFTASVAY